MLADRMEPGEGQRSVRAAMHAIADALTAHGFAAHAEDRGESTAVVAEHCPFGEAATQHPVICAVDRGMVRGLLAGLCGEERRRAHPGRAVVAGPRRRRLRRAGLSPGAPLPRPRLHLAAASRGGGGHDRLARVGRATTPATRAGSTPKAASSGPRWRRPGNRSPRCSARARARWSSPRAGPRRSTPRRGGRPGPDPGGPSCSPTSSTPRCATRRRAPAPVVRVAVDRLGRIDPAAVDERPRRRRRATARPPALVHCQAANHEVGTVQPVARGRRGVPAPRRPRARRRVRGRRPRRRWTSTSSAPTSCR